MVTLIEWTAIASAVAGISAVMLILIQLWHMDKHRDLEISIKLFEWAETERIRKAFKWVETEFQFEDYEKYKAEVERDSEVSDFPHQVEAFFEEVGFLVNKKFVELDVIVDRLGSDIVFNWKKLEPWILALRKETEDRTFGEHFQKLYEKTIVFMRKNAD